MKAGAKRFSYSVGENQAEIGFQIGERFVRYEVHLPKRTDDEFKWTANRRWQRTPGEQEKAWQQGVTESELRKRLPHPIKV